MHRPSTNPEYLLRLQSAGDGGMSEAEVAHKAAGVYWDHVSILAECNDIPRSEGRGLGRIVRDLYDSGIKDMYDELIDARAEGVTTPIILSELQARWLGQALLFMSDQPLETMCDSRMVATADNIRARLGILPFSD